MRDWAFSSDGFHDRFASRGAADAASRRIAAWLARPAAYRLSYATLAAPPAPGRIRVSRAAANARRSSVSAPSGAVGLVIDASGSMLQRLGGRRKIDVEKELLDKLVRTGLPEGTQFALRVFGQGGEGSCRTDLVLPLAPLDRTRVGAVVRGIRSTNGAKTPLAESLKLVAADLAAAQGPKLVVLVTDGEETCGGDPEAEIRAARSAGLDVRLNIVGFAVDTLALRGTFQRWAELGGGRYFDATDRGSLERALAQALAETFEVVSATGAVVARGTVGGDEVAVPPGVYSVRIGAGAAALREGVEVRAGEVTPVRFGT